ncbi:MAG: hypothetical protein KA586_09325 [Candidatus Promineofilum sp.]|nr:hypothetical protein [Promineifilum sp.]
MNVEMSPPSPHRLLTAARAVWLAYAIMLLSVALASLPGYYNRVITGTLPDISFEIGAPTGNAFFTARATTAGLSLQQFLIANITVSLVIIFIHYLVAGLVFWRLPRSWFGLLTAFVILLTGSAAMEDATQVAGLVDSLGPVVRLVLDLGALVWPMFPVWLYLFPDGRAVPRWARWPIAILMGVFALFMIVALLDTAGLLPPALWQAVVALNERTSFVLVLVLPGLVLALVSQIYRYWRVSGPVERQQTKWFLFGLTLFVALFPLSGLTYRIDAISGSVGLTIIPIAIAIALLRYRLWDIDVVIRRTAGYAVLTGLLALVYFGSIIVLQRLLAPMTGDSTLATILSTLLIAALFLPLRRRVQDLIDRRFYRRKYDAAKVLEGFAATARDETDLDQLTAELVHVIQQTMEPEHVSIWLKPIDDHRPMTADPYST